MSFRPSALLVPVGLAALLATAPATAGAQFTSFVAHPPRPADTTTGPRAVALTDSARRAQAEAARRAEITNMKAWVDSAALAAGTRVPIPATPPTPAPSDTGAAPPRAAAPADSTAVTAEGLRAPDTATPLPALLLFGAGATLAGLRLLRRG